MTFTYDYPRPMVTVDILLYRYAQSTLETLLVQRKHPPFKGKWALPGGYVEMNEKLIDAASRELFEETGVKLDFLFPLTYADNPDRDPRGRTISFIFGGIASPPFPEVRGGDDTSHAEWYSLMNPPELAFDHDDIIHISWKQLKHQLQSRFLILAFLPLRFSLSDLEQLFQKIYPRSNRISEWLKQALEHNIVKEDSQNEFERIQSTKILYTSSFFYQ
jgi:8-oxo-dGTP diphosphatase